MKVLVFGYDRELLVPDSSACRRQVSFAKEQDVRLEIVLLSPLAASVDLQLSARVRVRGWSGSLLGRLGRALLAGLASFPTLVTAQDPFASGLLAYIVSRWRRAPFEIQEHADYFGGPWERERPRLHAPLARLGKWLMVRARHVRVVSERVRGHVVSRCGIDASRVSVRPVYQDVRTLLTIEIKELTTDVPCIVVPCRFVAQKGLDTLLNALGRLSREGVPFTAQIYGRGELESKVREWIDERGLASRVTIMPWAEPVEIWKKADLFVMSSNYEGWGRTLVEAMAAGVPIVTTDVGCVGSFLRPGLDGSVVEPARADLLADAIREALFPSAQRLAMQRSARERIAQFPTEIELQRRQRRAWEQMVE